MVRDRHSTFNIQHSTFNIQHSTLTTLLSVVRAGIYEDAGHLSDLPVLTEGEWEALYEESKRQTVSGIALHALTMLPDSKMPPEGVLLRWVARGDRIERSWHGMKRAILTLLPLFEEKGIRPVLQKGHAVGRFYPVPQLRTSGDVDLCFEAGDRRRADSLIAAKGTRIQGASDSSGVYQWHNYEIEHHSRLIELGNPFRGKELRKIIAEPPVRIKIGADCEAYAPAPLAELLMVNVHILKHILGHGIGLRHFCDYALARRALLPVIGEERYAEACRALGIARWTRVLDEFTDYYLCQRPGGDMRRPRRLTRKIFSMVMEGGNFGLHHSGRRKKSGKLKRKVSTLGAFMRNAPLALRLAPAEGFFGILRLSAHLRF